MKDNLKTELDDFLSKIRKIEDIPLDIDEISSKIEDPFFRRIIEDLIAINTTFSNYSFKEISEIYLQNVVVKRVIVQVNKELDQIIKPVSRLKKNNYLTDEELVSKIL